MELIRKCIFRPYSKGNGPVFTLTMYDTFEQDWTGRTRLAYKLYMKPVKDKSVLLFFGADFCCSPWNCIDSDESVVALMNFLTLVPGDTDSCHFDEYTSEQREYCDKYAAHLSVEVYLRFESEGRVI